MTDERSHANRRSARARAVHGPERRLIAAGIWSAAGVSLVLFVVASGIGMWAGTPGNGLVLLAGLADAAAVGTLVGAGAGWLAAGASRRAVALASPAGWVLGVALTDMIRRAPAIGWLFATPVAAFVLMVALGGLTGTAMLAIGVSVRRAGASR